MTTNEALPVLVLGAAEHGSLGIIRTLGRTGVPVFAVDGTPRGPASYSRYCIHTFSWDLVHNTEEATVKKLCEIGRWFSRPVILIPTWDEIVLLVERNQDELRRYFIFPKMPLGLIATLSNKFEMSSNAERLGVPAPRTEFLQSEADVARLSRAAWFPCVIKRNCGNERNGTPKARVVHNAQQLEEAYRVMREPGMPNLIVQELLSSEDAWVFAGYFDGSSRCLAGYTGRKLRQTPAHLGMMSLGVCMENSEIQDYARRLLSAVGYTGMVDIDFCRDPRDGKYKILDVNPRVGASFRLFVDSNGLDVIRVMYLDTLGKSVSSGTLIAGRKWMVERDFKSAFDLFCEGKLRIADWIRSIWKVDELGFVSWDDPIPALMVVPYMIGRKLAKCKGRNLFSRGLRHVEFRPSSRTINPAERKRSTL